MTSTGSFTQKPQLKNPRKHRPSRRGRDDRAADKSRLNLIGGE